MDQTVLCYAAYPPQRAAVVADFVAVDNHTAAAAASQVPAAFAQNM
jgi:hypothetical protein